MSLPPIRFALIPLLPLLPVLSLTLSCALVVGPARAARADTQAPLSSQDFDQIAHLIDEGTLLPARVRVETLLANQPSDWHVALLAGRLYRRMGLSGFAIVQYEKVRAQNPRMVEALIALSQLHLDNLSTEIAIVLARRAVEIDPQSKEARLALINALVAGQSLRQAREQATRLQATYPDDADVAHALSAVEQSFGQYDSATTLLMAALAKRPQMLAWRLELADLYLSRNNFEACRTVLNQVLSVEPHSLEALNNLAHLLEFDLHEYMPALRAYRAIKEIIPDSATAQAGIDRCLAKQSDFALNLRNSLYHLLGLKVQDAKLEESNDLPSSF